MTIPNNWYIADCTSGIYPYSHMEEGTFYLPINVTANEEDNLYHYQEYRFTMPIDYEFPSEISDALANELDVYSKQFGKRILSLENSQATQDNELKEVNKKAAETDQAILGLMDTILTMQMQP